MNIFKSKKLMAISLTFVMCMTLADLPLAAKERRGATVEVTMTDGRKVKGELLAVKADVLLIFDPNACQGRSLDLVQVNRVKILSKSKLGIGMVIGCVFGLGLTMLDTEGRIHGNTSMTPVPIAGLIGGILGALAGLPTTFSQTGDVSRNLQQNLDVLKRHAREQNLPSRSGYIDN
jgi:hypothetical protein